MDRLGKPLEERIQEILKLAASQHKPIPDPEEVRRQLKWRLEEEKYQEWRLRLL